MTNELDTLLPENLRPTTALLCKANQPEDAGTSVDCETGSSDPVVEQTMSTPNTAPVAAIALTNEQLEQIRSMASQEAAKIVAAKDSEAQVAKTIADLSTQTATARAEASAAKQATDKVAEELTSAKASIVKLEADLAAEKTEAAKQKKAAEDASKEKDDYLAKFKKAKADLDVSTVNSKVVERKAALASANIKETTKFYGKAIAATEDKTALKMSDEDFKDGVEDLKQPAPPAIEQAAAATTEKKDEPVPTQATASATAPAAPDLSAVGGYQMASAALVAGQPKPVASQVSKYAAAIN
jgi:hypothetical protein